jgi:hypothetical protein
VNSHILHFYFLWHAFSSGNDQDQTNKTNTTPEAFEGGIMAKLMTRGLTMLLLLVTVTFVTAVASANGQSRNPARANIPFDFAVGDKVLPAGEYQVSTMTDGREVIMVRSREGKDSAIRLTYTANKSVAPEKGTLVFRRYANHYFLAEIWTAGEQTGRRLLKSKHERAIEKELALISPTDSQNKFERVEVVTFYR